MLNYKTLFILRLLKSTIEIFVNSFFVMYFLTVSNQNVVKLGIYYILVYFTVYLSIRLLGNYSKGKNRINLLRVGIILNLVYFLLILFLQEKIVSYIYLMAIIYGLEEGFYYSVYNNFESISIKKKDRAKFSGIYTVIKSLISIIIPILFGSIITKSGFGKCTAIIVVLAILQIITSFIFKDEQIKDLEKLNLKEYKNQIKKYKEMKKMHYVSFINGIIFTGAYQSLVTLYVIKVLKSSIELGAFSSIFAIITCFLGFFFAKILPKKYYKITILISGILTVLGITLLIYKVNYLNVLIFNFLQTISATLLSLIIDNTELDMANYNKIIKKYRVEYFITMEKYIFIGRFIGYILYIILGISTSYFLSNMILLVFGFIIILLSISTMKLKNWYRD